MLNQSVMYVQERCTQKENKSRKTSIAASPVHSQHHHHSHLHHHPLPSLAEGTPKRTGTGTGTGPSHTGGTDRAGCKHRRAMGTSNQPPTEYHHQQQARSWSRRHEAKGRGGARASRGHTLPLFCFCLSGCGRSGVRDMKVKLMNE